MFLLLSIFDNILRNIFKPFFEFFVVGTIIVKLVAVKEKLASS